MECTLCQVKFLFRCIFCAIMLLCSQNMASRRSFVRNRDRAPIQRQRFALFVGTGVLDSPFIIFGKFIPCFKLCCNKCHAPHFYHSGKTLWAAMKKSATKTDSGKGAGVNPYICYHSGKTLWAAMKKSAAKTDSGFGAGVRPTFLSQRKKLYGRQ